MKILEDYGMPLEIGGKTWRVKLSLANVKALENTFGKEFSEIKVNYQNIGQFMSCLMNDYAAKHPDAQLDPVTPEWIDENVSMANMEDLMRITQALFAGKTISEDESTDKNPTKNS